MGKHWEHEAWAQWLVALTAVTLERPFSLEFEYNLEKGRERNH